ncbi:MAG: indole-3-glycerol phosphate synthase TrpC [Desulfobacteraceae bacterium]|nr:indole-3-glycerol phosphate synthase TrpC [Desulfobacteraceae bacterium]MBC2718012.1 indole-3-glycerol phosphate synthase TrpC [Desulfobacteraceae bacterium]
MGKDFLEKIVKHKKQEIAEAKKLIPESQLCKDAFTSIKRRQFIKKLEKPGFSGINIIAEIKRASPSKGDICLNLNPAAYAQEYEKGGAVAISVLTDQPYFKGSIDDLKKARNASTLPVLRKDFLISSYQIYESLVVGADAVLLIVRILSQEQLHDYLELCSELKLDALVEIHSEKDLEAATRAKARLIGINNRNLSSFETNINTAIRLVSLFEPYQIAVAASGILNRDDIVKNQQAGIWNFLIGESLVKAENCQEFLRSLMGLDGLDE